MIPHCAYCRFRSTRDWDKPSSPCKGALGHDPRSDDPPRPCHEPGDLDYLHFSPVDEVCAEDALDHLLEEFDKLTRRLEAIEKGQLRLVTRRMSTPIEWPEED